MKHSLLFFLLICFISCRKSFDNTRYTNRIVLPPYTETGAGTFGFMLDDSVWTVFGKHYYNNGFSSGWRNNAFEVSTLHTNYMGVNQLSVVGGGRMTIVKNDSVILDVGAGFRFIPTPPYVGTYYLRDDLSYRFAVTDFAKHIYYEVDSLRPVTLQINKFEKIDDKMRICSGRFFGVLHNEVDPNDSIIITDGRMDMKIFYK